MKRPILSAFACIGILFSHLTSAEAVEGGTRVKDSALGDMPYVGVIKLRVGQGICTGVAIHPRIVLTAAHCIVEGGAARWVYFGDEAQKFWILKGAYRTKPGILKELESGAHPKYPGLAINEDPSKNAQADVIDIGYIVLDENIPGVPMDGFPSLLSSVSKEPTTPKASYRYSFVGFGDPTSDSVYKNMLQVTALPEKGFGNPHLFPTSNPGIRPGDSGGPLWRQGGADGDQPQLVGIGSVIRSGALFQRPVTYFALIQDALPWLKDELGFEPANNPLVNMNAMICRRFEKGKTLDLKDLKKVTSLIEGYSELGGNPKSLRCGSRDFGSIFREAKKIAQKAREQEVKDSYTYRHAIEDLGATPSQALEIAVGEDIDVNVGTYRTARDLNLPHDQAMEVARANLENALDMGIFQRAISHGIPLKNALTIASASRFDTAYGYLYISAFDKGKTHEEAMKEALLENYKQFTIGGKRYWSFE